MSTDRPTFSSRIAIPLAWETLPGAPAGAALAAGERANRGVLDLLLRRIDLDAAPRPADERLAEALLPLRREFELIVEMLGRLSYRDVILPEPREVEIGLERIAWTSPEPLREGEWLRITLYFHPAMREAVTLYGEVVAAMNGGDGGWRVHVELPEMAEAVGESFARLVFLAHRRQLARRPARAVHG